MSSPIIGTIRELDAQMTGVLDPVTFRMDTVVVRCPRSIIPPGLRDGDLAIANGSQDSDLFFNATDVKPYTPEPPPRPARPPAPPSVPKPVSIWSLVLAAPPLALGLLILSAWLHQEKVHWLAYALAVGLLFIRKPAKLRSYARLAAGLIVVIGVWFGLVSSFTQALGVLLLLVLASLVTAIISVVRFLVLRRRSSL